ncbi:Uncharacterised protein [Raoultella planticola]|uniref:Uncharacterized protein n=1 Tax=Raoultella planticola TaxID=575 RepID=A0A485BCH1_RAOPL|nr:Uncharacterised protein [Raoultella planticola]
MFSVMDFHRLLIKVRFPGRHKRTAGLAVYKLIIISIIVKRQEVLMPSKQLVHYS